MTHREPGQVSQGQLAELEDALQSAETALRNSETALRNSEARFGYLVDAITDYAVYMLDEQGMVQTWNEGARRTKGYGPEIVGTHFSVLYTPEDRHARRPDAILEVVRKEGRFEEENWRVRKDGTRFWANVIITALRDSDGRVTGFAAITRDLTSRRETQENERKLQREQAAREASEAARADLAVANGALRSLTDLALALSNARTPDEVAAVIVEHGMRVAQADTCFLYLLDDKGGALDLLAHCGVAPEIVAALQRLTSVTTLANVRAAAPIWAETAADYERVSPAVARMQVPGPRVRAFWSVPLVAEGRPMGLLAMGFHEERRFPAEQRALVATLTQQCAQALLRALRAEGEERAHARLSTTLRSIGDAVVSTDTRGQVTMMNAAAEQLTGWTEAEAVGRALEEVFYILSEQTRRRCESPVQQVFREGRVVGLANHTVLRTRRGVEIPIDDSAAPIRDEHGNLFGVVLVFRDATSAKRDHVRREFLSRAGAALASSLDYRATLATVAQCAVPQLADWCTVDLVDPDTGRLQQVAVAHADPQKVRWAREMDAKFPPDPNATSGAPQVVRTGRSELYPELTPELIQRSARDPEHLRILRELDLQSAMVVALPGRERSLGVLTFVYAGSGRRYSEEDLAFAEDFARRAALAIDNALTFREAQLARAQERALRREADVANRAKDEFLATVSHELRTPMNAVLGWTITLRQQHPAPELDRPLAIIERNARRQARLVEDVLDISRIISGKLALHVGPVRVAEVIENAIESLAPAAEAKQIRIRSELDPSLTITADSDRLQQVVWNLLSNAVKFTPKGGDISIRASLAGSELRIAVTDTGEGIAAEVLPHVFEPFRQADASTTRRHGGLGLGLAIVRQIAGAHGGTIVAESEGLGRGATFTVSIPARGVVRGIAERVAPAAPTHEPLQGPMPSLEGVSILVVDDEPDAVDVIAHVLREQRAKVTVAESAPTALDLIPRVRPDVIVSDIGMPDMDGYMLLRRVRALPVDQGGRTPALALTAYARTEDAQRAFAAGFQMHVPKPVEPAQLISLVANLAGLSMPVLDRPPG